jgi:hypothetical protein
MMMVMMYTTKTRPMARPARAGERAQRNCRDES